MVTEQARLSCEKDVENALDAEHSVSFASGFNRVRVRNSGIYGTQRYQCRPPR